MSRKLYWHFLPADGKLEHGDGRVVKVGEKLTVDGEPILCEHGLHACARLIDALNYAPGPILCKVRLGGTIVHGDDKCVASERTVVAMADVSAILREFARTVAAKVWFKEFKRGQYPAVDLWLDRGEEADKSAAKRAAWSAAWSAAESAAWSAAGSASWSAARSAAWNAARSAAWSAARSDHNKLLLRMIRKAEWRTK